MLMMDWLAALRMSRNLAPPRKGHRRRNRRLGFAMAAEVLEIRNMLGSLVSPVAGSLMIDTLSQSPGEASPPLTESFFSHDGADGILPSETLSANKTLYVQPENAPLTSKLSSDSEQASLSNAAPSLSAAGSSQAQPGILPGVLDDALTSALHSQSSNSPSPSFLPPAGITLPAATNSEIADQNAAGQSPGTTISQSSSTGNGNAPASTGTSSTGDTSGINASTLSSISSISIPATTDQGSISQGAAPTQGPTPRSHGEIQPLRVKRPQNLVQIRASDSYAHEGGNPGEFTIQRTHAASSLTVGYQISGTATEGRDYPNLSGIVTFNPGERQETVLINPYDDLIPDSGETVVLTLTSVSDGRYTIDPDHQSDTVTIYNTESGGGVWIWASQPDAYEGGTPGEFTVSRDSGGGQLDVYFSISGAATEGSDFYDVEAAISIPNSATEATILINPIDDGIYEGDEDVVITLTGVSDTSYTIDSFNNTDAVWILDDETSGGGSGGSGGNSAPVAEADYYTILHDQTLTDFAPGVVGNDWDIDADDISNSATLDAGPTNGTLTYFNSDGSFEYVPTPGWTGTDSLTYHVNDGLVDSNIATVTIDVTNDPPSAWDDYYSVQHNITLSIAAAGVLANDSDFDGDPLTMVLESGPSYGTLTWNADGSFDYTPNPGWAGTDSFTYFANDGVANSSTPATVMIDVTNEAPYAMNDSFGVLANSPEYNLAGGITVSAPGVLSNDTDADGDSLAMSLETDVSNGTLQWNTDGSFTYLPYEDFIGTDTFTYRVTDGTFSSDPATVTLNVSNRVVSVYTLWDADESGPSEGVVNIERAGDLSSPLQVAYTVDTSAPDSASPDLDYTSLTGIVTIPAGVPSAPVTITPVADSLAEGNESVIISLATDPAYAIDTVLSSASLLILDNENIVSVEATRPFTDEGDSQPGVFTLRRTGDLSAALSVTFTVETPPTAATPDDDYVSLSGTANFSVNEDTVAVDVLSVDDSIAEPVETVDIQLVSGVDYSVDPNADVAAVVVVDDEPVVSIEATVPVSSEMDTSPGEFTVTRSGSAAGVLVVYYSIDTSGPNAAIPMTDYVALSGYVTIADGQSSATILVTPEGDSLVEGDEIVDVTLDSGSDYHVSTTSPSATVVIEDAEPVVSIEATVAEASEIGLVNGEFTVTRTGDTTNSLVVTYQVDVNVESPATSGVDYVTLSGSVTIEAMMTTATIDVQPLADAIPESIETVDVVVQSGSLYSVDLENDSAVVEISDAASYVSIEAGADARRRRAAIRRFYRVAIWGRHVDPSHSLLYRRSRCRHGCYTRR